MSHKAAESAGKIPDAREEARKIQAMKHARRGIAYAIADIQKRTLLAAAVQLKTYEGGPLHFKEAVHGIMSDVAEWLERLAEQIGRQG